MTHAGPTADGPASASSPRKTPTAKIRTETPHDIDRVREVITAAFGSSEDETGTVIAHILFTRAAIGDTPSLTLAPVSVDPARQGTGIGSTLIRAGLDAARTLGEHTVTVLGHPAYYPRFGFERADAHGVTCTLSAGPEEAKMVLSLDARPIPSGDMTFGKPMADAVSAYQPQ